MPQDVNLASIRSGSSDQFGPGQPSATGVTCTCARKTCRVAGYDQNDWFLSLLTFGHGHADRHRDVGRRALSYPGRDAFDPLVRGEKVPLSTLPFPERVAEDVVPLQLYECHGAAYLVLYHSIDIGQRGAIRATERDTRGQHGITRLFEDCRKI